MKVNTRVLGLLAIVGTAFAAGRMNLVPVVTPVATAEPLPQEDYDMPPEVQARMEAMERAAKPGKHHEHLNLLVGEWEGTFRMWMAPDTAAMEVTGTVVRTWIMDGRYIKENVSGTGFEGLGFIGYNNVDGQYEVVWMENFATAIMFETGWYDPDEKTMHFSGTRRDAETGKVIRTASKMDLSSPDHHKFVAWTVGPDGRRYKSFEGAMHRKTTD